MYNTRNPLGSTSPKDFSDNSEITDRYVNDVANETTQDRFGRSRLTIHGQQERARRSFEQFQSSAANVIANLGFFPPVDYTTGLTVDSRNFTTTYNGIVYAAQPSAVPFTTGAWDAAQWYPIQNLLNQKNLLIFDTYAEASAAAATLPDGQVVVILNDDGHGYRKTINTVSGATLITDGYVDESFVLREPLLSSGEVELNLAVSAAKEGSNVVAFNGSAVAQSLVQLRGEVIFLGKGEVSGDGFYRRAVTPEFYGSRDAREFVEVTSGNLNSVEMVASPSVVLVGSSSGTWGPDAVSITASLPAYLESVLPKVFGKTPKFKSLAIGGQTLGTLDTKPSIFPNWYVDTDRAWLDYVADESPNLVFIVIGSNDSSNVSYTSLHSVVNKLKAMPSKPSVVLITQPAPNLSPGDGQETYGTKAVQEGRDMAAGLIRSYARFNRLGLIDSSRAGQVYIDGLDQLDTIAKRVEGISQNADGVLFGPECHDFSVRLTISDADLQNRLTQDLDPFMFRVGPGGSGTSGDIVMIRRSPSGFFSFACYTYSRNSYANVTTAIPVPAGNSITLDIAKIGTNIHVCVSSDPVRTKIVLPIIARGGMFTPRFQWHNSRTGPVSSVSYFNKHEPRRYVPKLTSSEAWGVPNGLTNTKLPFGGNGVNHLTSLGTKVVYGDLVKCLPVVEIGTGLSGRYSPSSSASTGLTVTEPMGFWTRVGNIVTVTGKVTVSGTVSGSIRIGLPIASDLKDAPDLSGIWNTPAGDLSGVVWADNTLDMAFLNIPAVLPSSPQNLRFTFTYVISY